MLWSSASIEYSQDINVPRVVEHRDCKGPLTDGYHTITILYLYATRNISFTEHSLGYGIY